MPHRPRKNLDATALWDFSSTTFALAATATVVGMLFFAVVGFLVVSHACRSKQPPITAPVCWEDDGDWDPDPQPVYRVILPLLRRMMAKQNQLFRL